MTPFKQIFIRLGILCVGIFGLACSGSSDDDPGPASALKLQAAPGIITANGSDAAVFTVFDGTTDVTADAVIRCTTDNTTVSNASFSAATAGEYVFRATYGEMTSNEVKVTAKAGDTPSTASQFVRHICVMEFTGQWCANCPAGYSYMKFILDRNFPDVTHVIALHDNTGGKDSFALSVQQQMSRDYSLGGYPSALVDMRDLCALTNDVSMAFKASVKASQSEYPAHCGVAVKSAYDAAAKKAKVTVRLHSEKTGNYKIALWVVEDRINAEQNVSGVYQDYVHGHVARLLVGSTPDNYKGESLGEIANGSEATKEFEVPVDAAWNLENTTVYALAIDADGHVNNMSTCKIADGDTDYDRVTE